MVWNYIRGITTHLLMYQSGRVVEAIAVRYGMLVVAVGYVLVRVVAAH
jgi:hypothetical protein